jgi:hypothetical protein
MLLPERATYALILYAIIMALLAVYKPAPLFLNGRVRRFGTGEQDTVVSLGVACVVSAIFSVAAFTFVDIVVPEGTPSPQWAL